METDPKAASTRGPFSCARRQPALLAALLVGVVGAWALLAPLKRDVQRRADLEVIQASLEAYKGSRGHYPPDVSKEAAEGGGVDGCASVLLSAIDGTPEDPLFTGGYAQPGSERWCYYYRRGRGDGYQLFARLELPWGSPAGCGRGDLYRPELQDFDVCLLADQPPASPRTRRHRLREATLLETLLPLLLLSGALVAARRPAPRSEESTEEGPGEWLWAGAALIAWLTAFHVLISRLLRWYYAHYLPHYDSVGMYTEAARIVGLARAGHIEAAFPHFTGLGWLSPAFALLASPWITLHPAGFQLLNTLCVGLFASAVAVAARSAGASLARGVVVSLVVLLPDALMNWDGGYQDFKRDSQFLPLLGATYFFLFAHLWQPRRALGAVLGVAAGLTVWSRGEAIVYMGCLLGPITLAAGWRQGWRRTAGALRLSAVLAGTIALPFLIGGLPMAVARRAAHLAVYTVDSPWSSLRYYWIAPFRLWAATSDSIGASPATLGLALGQAAVLLGGTMALFGGATGRRPSIDGRMAALLLGGGWVYVSTVAILCLGMRWAPGYGWAGYPPFYPALLAPISVAMALIMTVTRDEPPARALLRWAAVTVLALVSCGLVGSRMWLRAPQREEPVATARWLLEVLRAQGSRPVVALMTHDRIDMFTLMFYEGLQNYDPARELQRFWWRVPSGLSADFAYIMPPGGDVVAHQRMLLEQLREVADVVIVNADLSNYSRPPDAWTYFLPTYGRPVVEEILHDPDFARVGSYAIEVGGERKEFLILRNQRRVRNPHGW